MLGLIGGVVLSVLAAQAAASAADEEAEQICLATAIMWGGDNRDIGRIEAVPVPDSYRRIFEAGGCARWQLVEETLIDWHLAYGSERSVTAALAYLETDYRSNAPDPDRLRPELDRAWAAAERDYRQLAEALRQEGEAGRAAEVRLRRSPRLRRLQQLAATHTNYIFLADQYLRAAEAYGSAALLAKAASYEAAAQAGFSLLYRNVSANRDVETLGLARYLGLWEWHIEQLRDVEIRLPILRARLSRRAADIEAAQAALDRNFTPVLREALDRSYENDGAVCDADDEDAGQPDSVQAACASQNYFPWRVIRFWRNQLQLDLVKASLPDHYGEAPYGGRRGSSHYIAGGRVDPDRLDGEPDLDPVTKMLERARREHITGPSQTAVTVENLIALHAYRADLLAQLAELSHLGEPSDERRDDLRSDALGDLVRASRFAMPTERPTWFRRIAQRYLAIFATLPRAPAEEDRPRRHQVGDQARYAVYFRETLRALDRISHGAVID